eukprot:5784219-Pleurochrysis_carterae.AAC.1
MAPAPPAPLLQPAQPPLSKAESECQQKPLGHDDRTVVDETQAVSETNSHEEPAAHGNKASAAEGQAVAAEGQAVAAEGQA